MSKFRSANSLRMNQWNVIKLCICIDIDKLEVGIIIHQLLQISNRVMAINSCYFCEIEWIECKKKSFLEDFFSHTMAPVGGICVALIHF